MDLPQPKPRHFSLRFISGKYQGGEYPVVPNHELIVGRSNDIDIVLIEDMVSRRHARILLQDDSLIIEDLGSTNGTFVNGEKVRRARLKEGDKVLIGTSIIRVALEESASEVTVASAKLKLQDSATMRRTHNNQVRTMAGSLSEISLVDLLQLFSTSRKSGILVVRRDEDAGRIHLRRGVIVHATLNESAEIPSLKTMYRLLTWQHGTFELDPPDDREFSDALDRPTEVILMEGMRQMDELERLSVSMPSLTAHLSIPSPLTPPLSELSANELDILQLAFNHGHVEAVMDRSQCSDLEASEILIKLLSAGYLRKS